MALQRELEAALAGLPEPPPWMDDEALRSWQQRRRDAGRRHRAWRDGSDSWDHLYEDAEHRIRALAGSLARELGEMLEVAAAAAPGAPELDAWMQGAGVAWVDAVRRQAVPTPDSPVDLAAFLDEFVDRERSRARARLQTASPATAGMMAAVLRRLRAVLRRALFPGAQGTR